MGILYETGQVMSFKVLGKFRDPHSRPQYFWVHGTIEVPVVGDFDMGPLLGTSYEPDEFEELKKTWNHMATFRNIYIN